MTRCAFDECCQEVDNGIYIQCQLQKQVPGGILEQVSWIPREFAVRGAPLKLRDRTGAWVDGWRVVRTYAVDRGRNLGTVVEECGVSLRFVLPRNRRAIA